MLLHFDLLLLLDVLKVDLSLHIMLIWSSYFINVYFDLLQRQYKNKMFSNSRRQSKCQETKAKNYLFNRRLEVLEDKLGLCKKEMVSILITYNNRTRKLGDRVLPDQTDWLGNKSNRRDAVTERANWITLYLFIHLINSLSHKKNILEKGSEQNGQKYPLQLIYILMGIQMK